jgi:hypothetical protein
MAVVTGTATSTMAEEARISSNGGVGVGGGSGGGRRRGRRMGTHHSSRMAAFTPAQNFRPQADRPHHACQGLSRLLGPRGSAETSNV